MTDILDLPNWKVSNTRTDGGTFTIEAAYEVQPDTCPKCGCVGNLYRHGTKPVSYVDSPVRGAPTKLLAKVQRYRCRDCNETFLQSLGGILADRRKTEGNAAMSKLTNKQRKNLPLSAFAGPGRSYPVSGTGSEASDRAHAANAKARATQQNNAGNLSDSEKAKIDAKANKVLGNSKK